MTLKKNEYNGEFELTLSKNNNNNSLKTDKYMTDRNCSHIFVTFHGFFLTD